MQIIQYPSFQRVVKKLHTNAKRDLDKAIEKIMQNPLIGDVKKGDLNGIRVFKFKMVNQLTLLAYLYLQPTKQNDRDSPLDGETDDSLTLLALGSHENFYRDLKNSPVK